MRGDERLERILAGIPVAVNFMTKVVHLRPPGDKKTGRENISYFDPLPKNRRKRAIRWGGAPLPYTPIVEQDYYNLLNKYRKSMGSIPNDWVWSSTGRSREFWSDLCSKYLVFVDGNSL